MHKYILIFLIPFLFIQVTVAQPSFKIILMEGTTKAQRSQKKSWENISTGDKINDNDIVETYFRTKLILQYGVENVIILGSNTRGLFNIKEISKDDVKSNEVNITLFSGGALVKIVADSRVNIYTANAVAQIDSGTISTVVEARTGHTGFQTLGGTAQVRNVAQQHGKELPAGLTTIILPGKEPTAPLYITYRHVAVLKHFFGDEFIDHEIESAGINPTEDKSSTHRLSLSQALRKSRSEAEGQMYKRLFSLDKIYGLILDDRARKKNLYKPIQKPLRPFENKGEIEFNSSIGITGGTTYPKFSLIPSLHFSKFSFGLNLPLAKNASGNMSMNFAPPAGILDKINHIAIGKIEKSRYFKLWPIEKYTIAEGLIVNNYQNKNIYTVTQPLGITMQMKNNLLNFNAFFSDVTNWYVGGLHFGLTPGNAWLGVGYYYDANQYKNTLTSEISRFIEIDTIDSPSGVLPDQDSLKSNVHIYELNFGIWHKISESISLNILFQFAQKIAKGGANGYVIKGPELGIEMDNFNFGLSYITETGKLLAGHFSSMYMSNRLRVQSIINDTVTYQTQNNFLSENRKSYGFILFFRVKPIKGTAIDFSFRQDFLTRYPFMDFIGSEYKVDSSNINNNFEYTLSLIMNEELWSPIKYAEIYLNQIHGGFYPKTATYFASWGFNTGFDILTAPLFLNIAFEAGLNFSYIDLYDSNLNWGFPNNNIDSGDNLLEFYVGFRWGFR